MLLAYHRELVERLREPSADEPWRVLVSGCLAGWACGTDGSDYGLGATLAELAALPTFRALPFCPEQHALGTPRSTPDLHDGDGFDVLDGRARVFDEHGVELTSQLIAGARAMLAYAQSVDAELAILTDMSAACGSQVVSLGCRFDAPRRFQKGVGVATALLLRAGVLVVSQRDFHTLGRLRARLQPEFLSPEITRDHHEHAWTIANLPDPHPRA
ncbi:MAG TPA: 2-thiouracil desulfurase family protein [Nannocystaceae bacterium]|nr:2-thiouracil desulfurase family protein [Nannocystaceae bacterium]